MRSCWLHGGRSSKFGRRHGEAACGVVERYDVDRDPGNVMTRRLIDRLTAVGNGVSPLKEVAAEERQRESRAPLENSPLPPTTDQLQRLGCRDLARGSALAT